MAFYDLYVFDWDGTVMDTTATIVRGIAQANRAMGLPLVEDRVIRTSIGLGIAETMAIVAPTLPRERWGEFQRHYRDWYLQREEVVQLFEGMEKLLRGLRGAGRHLAVATGKSRAGLDRVLQQTGLRDVFDGGTKTADECFSKPHPQMLEELMAENGVDPDRVVMIGDTNHDLQMAANAGCRGIGVTYGASSRDVLERIPHEAVVDSVQELARVLEFQTK